MNNRKDRLNDVLGLKNKAVDTALNALNHAKAEFQAGKAKHEQLLAYRQDYLQQLEFMGEEGCSVGRMRNRIDFITQLDDALSQMNQHLAQLAKIRSKAEAHYLAARQEEAAVSKLMARLDTIALSKENKQHQKEMDEHAQKQWYSRQIETKSLNESD